MTCDDDAGPAMGHERRPYVWWSRHDLAVLAANYARTPKAELMALLPGHTWDGIRSKARDCKAESTTDDEARQYTRRASKPGPRTPDWRAALVRLYPAAPRAEVLAALPGWSWRRVCARAKGLGVLRCADEEGHRQSRQDERRRLSEAARHEAETMQGAARPHDPMRRCPSVWHLAARVAASVGAGARA